MGVVNVRISGICAFFEKTSPPRMIMLNARDVQNTQNEQQVVDGHVASLRWKIAASPTKPPGADLLGPQRNLAAVLLRGQSIVVRSTVLGPAVPTIQFKHVVKFDEVAGTGYALKPEYAHDNPSALDPKHVLGFLSLPYGSLSDQSTTDIWHFFPSPLKSDLRVARQVTWTFTTAQADLMLDLVDFKSGSTRQLTIPTNTTAGVDLDLCNCMEKDLFVVETDQADGPGHELHLHGPDWHFEAYYRMFNAPAGAARPAVPYLSGWDEEAAGVQGEALHGGNCPPVRVG